MQSAREAAAPRVPEHELADLLRRIAGGDREALGRFYDCTGRFVFGLALRILQDPAAAEEVTLEVYAQLWQDAETFGTRRGAPTSWLLAGARDAALARVRAGARAAAGASLLAPPDAAPQSPSAEPEAPNSRTPPRPPIELALETLPAEARQAIELAYFGGLSRGEMARALGQPAGVVTLRLQRAMAGLRGALPPSEGVD